MEFRILPLQKKASWWLLAYSVFSFPFLLELIPVNSIIRILGFAHFFGFHLVYGKFIAQEYKDSESPLGKAMLYVKENYPMLWGKNPDTLDNNNHRAITFIMTQHEGGKDVTLNELRFYMRINFVLAVWAALLAGFIIIT